MRSDSEDDRDTIGDLMVHNFNPPKNISRIPVTIRSALRSRERVHGITTNPNRIGAGETETEADEPPRQLPTARVAHSAQPVIPPTSLQERLTPLLFAFSRWLSIVPAVVGSLFNLYRVIHPPPYVSGQRRPPERVDFLVSALWAILTGYQCLHMTTGLLNRWNVYYPPISALIRLLALQGICWPATRITLTVLDHHKRPVIAWAVIGTSTCVSRSAQIWVTSNLWWEKTEDNSSSASSPSSGIAPSGGRKGGYWKRWRGGKWGGRRWDWREVGVRCVLPAGIVYFVMAWAEVLRKEFSGC